MKNALAMQHWIWVSAWAWVSPSHNKEYLYSTCEEHKAFTISWKFHAMHEIQNETEPQEMPDAYSK